MKVLKQTHLPLVLGIAMSGWLVSSSFTGKKPVSATTLIDSPTKSLIARGERIVMMNCSHCHSNADGRLAGRSLTDLSESLGHSASANITKHRTQGIGAWTDAQLIRLLRTGVRPDGHKAFFVMPRYPLLADDDMNAIVAFLRSNEYAVRPTSTEMPRTRMSLLSKFIMMVGVKPLPEPIKPIPFPDTNQARLYGAYLVNNQLQCFACHSANVSKTNSLKPTETKGYLAGGAKLLDDERQVVYSANLTPDNETGIGRYTEAEFANVLKLGRKRDGNPVRYPMLPYPLLTSREIHAIYTYLRSVPAYHHMVKSKKNKR